MYLNGEILVSTPYSTYMHTAWVCYIQGQLHEHI